MIDDRPTYEAAAAATDRLLRVAESDTTSPRASQTSSWPGGTAMT